MERAPRKNNNKEPSTSPLKSKVARGKGGAGKKQKVVDRVALPPSLLEVMNKDRDCACEIIARTLQSNVHKHMGLSHVRGALAEDSDSQTSTPPDRSTLHSKK